MIGHRSMQAITDFGKYSKTMRLFPIFANFTSEESSLIAMFMARTALTCKYWFLCSYQNKTLHRFANLPHWCRIKWFLKFFMPPKTPPATLHLAFCNSYIPRIYSWYSWKQGQILTWSWPFLKATSFLETLLVKPMQCSFTCMLGAGFTPSFSFLLTLHFFAQQTQGAFFIIY